MFPVWVPNAFVEFNARGGIRGGSLDLPLRSAAGRTFTLGATTLGKPRLNCIRPGRLKIGEKVVHPARWLWGRRRGGPATLTFARVAENAYTIELGVAAP